MRGRRDVSVCLHPARDCVCMQCKQSHNVGCFGSDRRRLRCIPFILGNSSDRFQENGSGLCVSDCEWMVTV